MRVAIYARTSVEEEQRPEVQIEVLKQACADQGWEVVNVYRDEASAIAIVKRKSWQRLMDDVKKQRFDLVMVWKLDRAFRSVIQATNTLFFLRAYGIGFKSYTEPHIDTTTPYGEFMFHLMASFAELDRKMIAERIKAGIEHSRLHGTRSGKPFGRPRVKIDEEKLINAYRSLSSVRAAARVAGCNPGTAWERLKAAGLLTPKRALKK